MNPRFVPRLVDDEYEPPPIVHASPGLLAQFSQVCLTVVALVLVFTAAALGFVVDALYQAAYVAAKLGGQELEP